MEVVRSGMTGVLVKGEHHGSTIFACENPNLFFQDNPLHILLYEDAVVLDDFPPIMNRLVCEAVPNGRQPKNKQSEQIVFFHQCLDPS